MTTTTTITGAENLKQAVAAQAKKVDQPAKPKTRRKKAAKASDAKDAVRAATDYVNNPEGKKPAPKKKAPAKTERRSDGTIKPKPKTTKKKAAPKKAAKKTTAKKAVAKKAKAKANGRFSALTCAAKLLEEGFPVEMSSKAMIEELAERKIWTSPAGKTPHATLYAAIIREIAKKGKDARFRKTDRGRFAFNQKAEAKA